jgi:hypothetical protein
VLIFKRILNLKFHLQNIDEAIVDEHLKLQERRPEEKEKKN